MDEKYMSEVIVEANGLSKAYKMYDRKKDMVKEAFSLTRRKYHHLFYSLSDVSFQINKGEMVGIIGENGAGKSTLLKLLTGVTKPTSGYVEVKGKIAALLELGAGFNPNYTGVENIYLNGTMMGLSKDEVSSRLEEIIHFADIGDFINQPVKSYSSGMFARLAFAVAINVEPDVLIVDEALSVGDIFFQNKCFRRIENLKEKGVTILYVSHDLASVKEMCDKALWLEHGQIKMYGDCTTVCNEYSNSLLDLKGAMFAEAESREDRDKYDIDLSKRSADIFPPISYTNESILSDNIEIKGCIICGEDGRPTNHIKQNEKCKISVLIESRIELRQGILGFILSTPKGVPIINQNSIICDNKNHIHFEKDKTYIIDFDFQMPAIMRGDYLLEVAIANGVITNYETHTWLYNVMSVYIDGKDEQYALVDVDTSVKVNQV